MDRVYVIIDKEDVSNIDFSKVMETSENTLRYKNDGSQTFVKFVGSIPDFLQGKQRYTNEEIKNILDMNL